MMGFIDTPTMVVLFLLTALVALVVYGLGYAFSLGFHRAKREFIARMVKDSCKGK